MNSIVSVLRWTSCLSVAAGCVVACGSSEPDPAADAGLAYDERRVSPTGFDEGCVRDDDCIGLEGRACPFCPACWPNVAVSKGNQSAYEAKKGEVACAPKNNDPACPGQPCGLADAVFAKCASAKCVLQPVGTADAGDGGEAGPRP